MRRKILSVVLTMGLLVSAVGCGASEEEKKAVNAEVESAQAETEEKEDVDIAGVKEIVSEEEVDTESTGNEIEYEEQKDIFIVKHIDTGDGTEIDFTNEEIINGPFILTDSIDIYSFFFTYAGYTKPNIKISAVGKIDEWISVPFAQSSFLVKAEDFDRVAVLEEKEETDSTESDIEAVIKAAPNSQKVVEPVQTREVDTDNETPPVSESTSQAETSVSAETTYSEAEVISIVETALRNAGCRKPEEIYSADLIAEFGPDAGMGWGIENIPMNDPYTAASQIVEGFQFARWTTYYIENQGSSDGYVHLKLYSGS